MKKVILKLLIALSAFSFFSCGSTSNENIPDMPQPEWYSNYRTVYPNAQYLAQKGSGKSLQDAKTDAVGQIARYFKTTVNANLTTTMNAIQKGDYVEETSTVVNETSVTSNMELFGIEYSEGYFNKAEKQWYCIAYIFRDDAWTQFQPQIESEKSKFYGFYDKAQKDSESLQKIKFYKSAWNSSKDFLEKLEFGRILHPSKESVYKNDRNTVSSVPSLIQSEMQKITVKIDIKGDQANIIRTAVANVFSKNNFTVGDSENYKVIVEIDSNEEGNNPLSILPSVKVVLNNSNQKSLYSYQYKSNEKTVSYTLENAQKKAFPKIAETIENEINSELQKQFGLK